MTTPIPSELRPGPNRARLKPRPRWSVTGHTPQAPGVDSRSSPKMEGCWFGEGHTGIDATVGALKSLGGEGNGRERRRRQRRCRPNGAGPAELAGRLEGGRRAA
ncbi:hypothetical protein NL676_012286 [Syzygium grande]|nr:hypothetical protein NL676_012286 [Syzygium grande]